MYCGLDYNLKITLFSLSDSVVCSTCEIGCLAEEIWRMVGDAGETRTVLVDDTGDTSTLLEIVVENLEGDIIGGIGRIDVKRALVFIMN